MIVRFLKECTGLFFLGGGFFLYSVIFLYLSLAGVLDITEFQEGDNCKKNKTLCVDCRGSLVELRT